MSERTLLYAPCTQQQVSGENNMGFLKGAAIAMTAAFTFHLNASAQPKPVAGVPALRVTAPSGRTSVLIGSVHIGVAGLRQPDASVLKGAKRYVVEQVPGEGPAAPPRRMSAEVIASAVSTGQLGRAAWARELTEQQVEGLKERLQCNGVPAESLEKALAGVLAMERAVTAEEIAIRRCAPSGNISRDEVLATQAKENGVPTSSLELNSEVEPRRLSVPDRIYLHHIRVAMTERQQQALQNTAEALNTGRYDLVARAMSDLAANESDAALYDRLMVVDRNEAWMPRLMTFLNEGDALVNVGVAHLPGKQGLIQLLRDRGFRVEPVALPAARFR